MPPYGRVSALRVGSDPRRSAVSVLRREEGIAPYAVIPAACAFCGGARAPRPTRSPPPYPGLCLENARKGRWKCRCAVENLA